MLTHLHIRDFAIIDSVEVDLRSGLTVLTGETGAGKSILVDALQLAAGGRGGSEVVRHGCERAEVTATFDLAHAPAALRELDAERLARMLSGVGVRTIRTWDAAGKLPRPVKIGGRTLWYVREVHAWLAAGSPDRATWEAMKAHPAT